MRILRLLTLVLIVSLVFMVMVLDMTKSYGTVGKMLGHTVKPLSVPMSTFR